VITGVYLNYVVLFFIHSFIQVFYPSQDGTKIPMFIVSKKGIDLDGSHPALLFGYGGFSMSMTPQFSVTRVVLMRNLGFVTCVANIRGGGEYGEDWHRAGSLANKQNCFDDFIAAGEFLVSAGYTSPARLCIEGGSNGGLLVAACMNQVSLSCPPCVSSCLMRCREMNRMLICLWVGSCGCSALICSAVPWPMWE
jgi:prolyl oligopeptidase PreP (S9A serine peptidase family)